MRTVRYRGTDGMLIEIKYDEKAPCIVCGEPVIAASMGGTNMCGSCDCGKCRYCGITICVFKHEFDGGQSKKAVLDHMKWHKKETPDLVKQVNAGLEDFARYFDKKRKKDPQIRLYDER